MYNATKRDMLLKKNRIVKYVVQEANRITIIIRDGSAPRLYRYITIYDHDSVTPNDHLRTDLAFS